MNMHPKYEFEIQGLYEGVWECLHTEPDIGLARESLKNYDLNDPGVAHRIKKVAEEKTVW